MTDEPNPMSTADQIAAAHAPGWRPDTSDSGRVRLCGALKPRDAAWASWMRQVEDTLATQADAPYWWRGHFPLHFTAPQWPEGDEWSIEWLRRQLPSDAAVQVQTGRNGDQDYEINAESHRHFKTWGEFLDSVENGEDNDVYLTAGNMAANMGLQPLLDRLSPVIEVLGLSQFMQPPNHGPFLWIGRGTRTPLHHDLTQNLMVQLAGVKRVWIAAPDQQPKLDNHRHVFSRLHWLTPEIIAERGIEVDEVELQPGHAFLLPVGWWHQVEAPGFSVTATFTNFRWPNLWTEGFPA